MDKVTEVTQEVGSATGAGPLTEAFTVDAAKVRAHVDEVVRSSVEQTLSDATWTTGNAPHGPLPRAWGLLRIREHEIL